MRPTTEGHTVAHRYGNDDFVAIMLGTGLNTYNIARSLHAAYGMRSLALGRVALRETAYSKIVDVRASRDFDSADFIVTTLLDLAANFKEADAKAGLEPRKLLLIPTVEFYVNTVIDNLEQLKPHFVIPLIGRELADRLMDKTAFYATCAQLGVAHPRTVVMSPDGTLDKETADTLPFEYPVIVKPSNTDIYPRLQFAGKQKVYLVDSAAELDRIAQLIFAAGYDDDLIIQEYIAGDESVMRVANTYSDSAGRMRFASVGQVILADHDPAMVGNNNAILTVEDPTLVENLRTLLDAVGYHGTANFDVMHDRRDGVSKVLELNVRQGATSFYTMAAGGNIVAALVEDVIYGRQLPEQVTTKQRLWLNLPYFLAVVFAPREWRKHVIKAGLAGSTHTLWNWHDLSLERLLTVLRVDARYVLSTLKYQRSTLGS